MILPSPLKERLFRGGRRHFTGVAIAAIFLIPLFLYGEDEAGEESDEPGIEEIVTTPPARREMPAPVSKAMEKPSKRPSESVHHHPKAKLPPSVAPVVLEGETEEESDNGPASASPSPTPEEQEGDATEGNVPSNARPPTSTGRSLPFRSVIHSVDPSAPLFTMGKKKIRVVHITTATRFSRVDGKPASFESLEPGLEVRGSARKLAQSEWEAVSVKIGSKAAAETGTLDD